MKIDRTVLDQQLLAFALRGHGLVLGDPGIGKTYSLKRLAIHAEHTGMPFLWLSVERLGSGSEEDLRGSIGYAGTFEQALLQLFASAPKGGLIVVDGFDAARNVEARERFLAHIRKAIELSPDGWHVIVSVRNYDAGKSPRLLQLFGLQSSTADAVYSRRGVESRHFLIPELTDAEVESAVAQVKGCETAYQKGSKEFRRLLRSPFNLWLLERIVAQSADLSALTVLTSEVQLLARFWTVAVSSRADDSDRRLVLKDICDAMVAERRLAVRKTAVYKAHLGDAWQGLLSDEVLVEVDEARELVAFRHNILFDYAVAIMGIERTAQGLAEFLSQDDSRTLFLRPSLVFFFGYLWHFSRSEFWACFWGILPMEAVAPRLVARLIPPFVIASEARTADELEPLRVQLQRDHDTAGLAIAKAVVALRYVPAFAADAWAVFAESLQDVWSPTFAWEVGASLSRSLEKDWLSKEGRRAAGGAARSLLNTALTRRAGPGGAWYDSLGSVLALRLVLVTVDTDPAASRTLIVQVMQLIDEPGFPIGYFYALSNGIEPIAKALPDITAEVYRVVFGHKETGEERTHLGGIVMPLMSTRRQDFEACQYALAHDFPIFLNASPYEALQVCIDVVNQEAAAEGVQRFLPEGADIKARYESFDAFGGKRNYLPDEGFIRDFGRREDAANIATTAKTALIKDTVAIEPARAVEALVSRALVGSAWSLILEVGAARPEAFASLLFDLALAPPILFSLELYDELDAFIARAYPFWGEGQREEFERAVLALERASRKGWKAERIRQRIEWLLGRPDRSLLVTEEARGIASAPKEPEERKIDRGVHVTSRTFGEDDWLSEHGVDIDTPENARLRKVRDTLVPFADKWSNATPDRAALDEVAPLLRDALEALRVTDGSDQAVVISAWTKLAATADAVLRAKVDTEDEMFRMAREVAMEAATKGEPEAPKSQLDYTWAHWSPSPRTEAIQALSQVLRRGKDPEVAALIAGFAASVDPSERFLTLRYAANYPAQNGELFWDLMRGVAAGEENEVVALGALEAMGYTGTSADDRRMPLIRDIVLRHLFAKGRDLRRIVADWITYFAFAKSDKWAIAAIDRLVDGLPQTEDIVEDLASFAMHATTPGGTRSAEGARAAARWVITLLEKLPALIERPTGDGVSAAGQMLGVAHKIVNNIVNGFYRGIRKVVESRVSNGVSDQADPGQDAALAEFYSAMKPILTAVLEFSRTSASRGMAAPTAYHLMEGLRELLGVEPRGIIATAADVALVSRSDRFHLDSMAVSEMVGLVETVLADHRALFAEGKPLKDLLTLLDVFADAGWPEAMALVWRLDEVYR